MDLTTRPEFSLKQIEHDVILNQEKAETWPWMITEHNEAGKQVVWEEEADVGVVPEVVAAVLLHCMSALGGVAGELGVRASTGARRMPRVDEAEHDV
jgi:hypothetical protein